MKLHEHYCILWYVDTLHIMLLAFHPVSIAIFIVIIILYGILNNELKHKKHSIFATKIIAYTRITGYEWSAVSNFRSFFGIACFCIKIIATSINFHPSAHTHTKHHIIWPQLLEINIYVVEIDKVCRQKIFFFW